MRSRTHETILKNTVFLIVGRLVSRAFQFLVLIYAARVLGAERIGVFFYASAMVGLLSIPMELGISTYIVQELSRNPSRTADFMGAGLTLKAALAFLGLCLIAGTGLALGEERQTLLILGVLGLYLGLENINNIFAALFRAREQMNYEALLISVSGLCASVLGFVSLQLFADLFWFSAVYVLGSCVRLILHGWWAIRLYGPPASEFDRSLCFDLLRKGTPFALVSGFITIYYYIDTVLLKAYWGNEVVGWYNAAYRLLEAPLFLSSALTTAIFPAASKLFQKNPDELKTIVLQAVEKALLFGTAIALLVAFFSVPLIQVIYGSGYEKASLALPILIFSVAIIFPSTILGTTIRAIGKQTVSAWVTGLAAALNVALNLAIIPTYSFVGAAWTTLITEIFVIVVYGTLVWRYLGATLSGRALFRFAGIVLLLWGYLHFTAGLGMWVQIIAYPICLVGLLLATRALSAAELKALLAMFVPQARKIA
ncbi:MAG: flippase [Deltaproteobacteria bacterium]|nr:flippase [Deltaproteobacteria bacterium]